jgi:DNA transformation protein
VSWLCERLAPLGQIRPKAMFGGFGVYCDGLFFAIVIDDQIFLKVDTTSRPEFEAAGCEPFTYVMRGKRQSMSYYTLPEEAVEDDLAFLGWARRGLEAALRARAVEEARPKKAHKAPAKKS